MSDAGDPVAQGDRLEGSAEAVHLLGLAQAEVAAALGRGSVRAAAVPSSLPDYDVGELEDAVSSHAVAWRAALRAGWSETGLRRLGLVDLGGVGSDHQATLIALDSVERDRGDADGGSEPG